MKVLQDIWILTDTGTVLFTRVFDSKMNSQLFGALMSALNTFAEKLANGGLSNFELSDKRFVLLKKQGLVFVANSSKKTKEKKVATALEKITERFFNLYPEEMLNKWDNDVSIFEDFEKEIQDSLENPIKNFWNGF